MDLQCNLAGTIEQRLRRAWLAVIEPLRRREHGEKRQPHDAAGPGYVDQQLRGQPAQAAGLDEVSLGGTNRIAVDAACVDLMSPAPLDGIVDANHHRGVCADEGSDQQAEQPASHRTRRPHGAVEHAMVDWEVVVLLPAENAQCRGDGSLAGCQDGAGHQQQDVLPGRTREQPGQAGQSRQQAFRQGGLAGRRCRIGGFHPMRRISPSGLGRLPHRR